MAGVHAAVDDGDPDAAARSLKTPVGRLTGHLSNLKSS
jgi:hypothetical protein